MTIYQLHEYSSDYDYPHDYIIGSYLRKERAEEEKLKAEVANQKLIERSKKCNKCPFLIEDFANIDELFNEHSDYCSEAKLEQGEYGIDCENYSVCWDENHFEVEEVEVEE